MSKIFRSILVSEENVSLAKYRVQKIESLLVEGDASKLSGDLLSTENLSSASCGNDGKNSAFEEIKSSVLVQIQDQLQAINDHARKRGFYEGREEGLREIKSQFEDELEKIRVLTKNVEQVCHDWIAVVEKTIAESASESIRLALDKAWAKIELVEKVKQSVLKDFSRKARVTVRLNDVDFLLLQALNRIGKTVPESERIDWVADAEIKAGSCKIESDLTMLGDPD